MSGYNGEYYNDKKTSDEHGKIVLSVLNNYFKKGEIIHTENLNESIAQLIDRCSGIDALYKCEYNISGVALRVQQHSERNWQTFTIRYERSTGTETEYAKRKRQIYNDKGHIFYPHFTCQAYLSDENKLLGGAFCLTRDLFDIAIKHEPFKLRGQSVVYKDKNKSDGNWFIVIPWVLFKKERILLFPENKEEMNIPGLIIENPKQLKIYYS